MNVVKNTSNRRVMPWETNGKLHTINNASINYYEAILVEKRSKYPAYTQQLRQWQQRQQSNGKFIQSKRHVTKHLCAFFQHVHFPHTHADWLPTPTTNKMEWKRRQNKQKTPKTKGMVNGETCVHIVLYTRTIQMNNTNRKATTTKKRWKWLTKSTSYNKHDCCSYSVIHCTFVWIAIENALDTVTRCIVCVFPGGRECVKVLQIEIMWFAFKGDVELLKISLFLHSFSFFLK